MKASHIWGDLHRVRNMRQALTKGLVVGGGLASAMDLTRGAFPGGTFRSRRDADAELRIEAREYPEPDGSLTFDKLSSVFVSGNRSRDDQPNHIRLRERVGLLMEVARGLGRDVPWPRSTSSASRRWTAWSR